MTKAVPPIAVERSVMTLLTDSIRLAMEAQRFDDNDFCNTLARASIVSSVLYVEACANCCVDLLQLPAQFAAEVDRMSTAAKLDLFLHMKYKGRAIDRSRAEYQLYGELRKFRDAFVHPKAQRYEWLKWSEEGSTATSPRLKATGLPRIPAFAYSEDALKALRSTHKFIGYFFGDLCRMRPTHVSTLLSSEDESPSVKGPVFPYWPRAIQWWLRREGVDMSYMRLGRL